MTTDAIDAAPTSLAGLIAPNADAFHNLPAEPEGQAALETDIQSLSARLVGALAASGLYYALYQALDLPLEDILRKGWASSQDLQQHRNPKDPNEITWVSFGKHKLTSRHKPKVAVLVEGVEAGSLTFDVEFVLSIAATKLRVQGGRIWEATGPSFDGTATISYRGFRLFRKKLGKVHVAQSISFEGGLPIPNLQPLG